MDKEQINLDENKEKEDLIDEDENVKKSKKEMKKEHKLHEQIIELENVNAKLACEVEHWKNKYYEAYADMDNLRKVMEKDHQQMVKYRGQGFLEALLPVFDNFYMCFKFKPEDPTLAAYCRGFEMIYNQMVASLENEGVKEVLPEIGAKFNHEYMQAVDIVDGEEDDIVVKVANKGYYLKDRLVRPAMVVVSKKPQPKVEESTNEDELEKENLN